MIATLVIGGYAFAMLLMGRLAYRAIREDSGGGAPPIDAALDGAMALIVGLFWPLVLPVAVIMWHPKPTTAEISAALSEREMENRRLQRKITELERELGIGAS
jgi:hypothetical protein